MSNKPELTIPPDVRNDASVSVAEVMKRLGADSIDVQYGDLMMRVEGKAVRAAAADLADKSPEARQRIRFSVMKALDRSAPKILKGRFTKKEADDCMADMCILHALNAYRS